ncbi:sugar transferase [Frankia sp. Cj3]|uniref:sugar transferase n=1 Tax=Frankia sp. Cj3 TaxID=2880976 RepID=UPI001EF55488|nr:sugar transferase [Frankia sp. Cj3]
MRRPPDVDPAASTAEFQRTTGGERYGVDELASAGPGIPPSTARRILDVVVSVMALVLLWPLLVTAMIVVRIDCPGPSLYRQVRVGQGGHRFMLYKLRTMRVDRSGPEITALSDPRVTRVGAFLRRTSLDELPQLVNVLRGQMTLVGPRPETLVLARRYPVEYRWIFNHRPGLTGPCQTRCRDRTQLPPGIIDIEYYYLCYLLPQRVALDEWYLRQPTLRRTMRMLWDTARHLAGRPLRPLR